MKEPLSETSVSLKLSLIRKRCSELMDEPEELELCQNEQPEVVDDSDPYNTQR